MGRRSRWWDLPAVLLLLATLMTASGRLVATEWVDHLGMVHVFVIVGLAAGLALGRSVFSQSVAAAFALIYGSFMVPWRLIVQVAYVSEDLLWSDRLVILVTRLAFALEQFLMQQPVYDPVLFLFAMAILSWTLSVHAGYTLTRYGRPWRIILPTGAALLLIHTADLYRPRGIWHLVAYLFLALLLLARLTFMQLRRRWEAEDARIPPLVGLDLSYAMVAAAVVLVLLAWTVPTAADALPAVRRIWERAKEPWEERMDDLFASLDRRGPTRTAAYYGEDFSLGRGRELSDALIFSVQAPADGGTGVRYYWRAKAYDEYANGEWGVSAFATTQMLRPSSSGLPLPELEGRRTVTFTFTSYEPIATMYAAPQPLWASRVAEVDLAENPDGTVDVAAFHASPIVRAGDSYMVRSSIADVTVSELRAAGTNYPEWVTDRYLDLPESITPRTRQLAWEIADGRDTPYDVVAAVTRYLRDNIRYSETITETLPSDQELLDWFLFDHQVGFCNYYASAEVVLLRVLGIPARLAVGYGAGERQPTTNTYVVYERNAHAWPEVYFPGLGWVEFEPTVSEDPIRRPPGETDSEDDDTLRVPPGDGFEDRFPDGLEPSDEPDGGARQESIAPASPALLDRIRPLLWFAGVLLSAIVVVLLRRWQHRRSVPPVPVFLERGFRRLGWTPPALLRRWAAYTLLSPVERAYMEIDRALGRLGVSPGPAHTPAERAATLVSALPAAAGPAHHLLAEYQAVTYGLRRRSLHAAQEAAHTIRRLSWKAKLRRLVGRDQRS